MFIVFVVDKGLSESMKKKKTGNEKDTNLFHIAQQNTRGYNS